ncbi:MAG: WYL domain-containing protein, partial [Bacteroidaceae bacterium]|nr:WYL domain-containing protein [Bacteroidaceae bacterium]
MISKTYYRYIWLLNLFLDGEAFTYEEIADLWKKDPNNGGVGLPLRTFHEHRKGIKEMFGVDIECDKSIGYAYFVRNYKVLDFDKPRKWLLNQYNIPKDFLVDYKMRDRILL